jgi:hypothetical protein
MDMFKVTASSSEVFYSGIFTQAAFNLHANGPVLYKAILGNLAAYGASLPTIKVDTSTLADANVTCGLPTVNGLFRVRLDRFDVNFSRFHEVGTELGSKIVVESWKTLREVDPALALKEHGISMNVSARTLSGSAFDLVSRYVKIPDGFPENTQAAVGLYFPIDRPEHRLFRIIFDRTVDADILNIRIELAFNAARADVEALVPYADSVFGEAFKNLGLTWE